jgi:nitrogen regulatory protein PII
MSIDGEMIMVTALIRPHMEGHVVRMLHDLPDFPGFTFTEVRGQGRGRGQGGSYVSSETDL